MGRGSEVSTINYLQQEFFLGEAGCSVAVDGNEEDKQYGSLGALGCICIEAVRLV